MSAVPPDRQALYAKAMAADEAFWCRQQGTVQGASGQPCCTLSGISTGLIRLEGNFAVVVHGEDECASCFLHYGPAAHRFFATGLEDHHFTTGNTADRLRRCLRLVAEDLHPDAIFVLGTCPIEVIGDRFETVVAEVQREFPDTAMRALHTSGLKVGTQAAMLDWMFSELVGLPPKDPSDPSWTGKVGDAAQRLYDAWVSGRPETMRQALDTTDVAPPPALDPARCVNFLGLPEVEALGGRGHEWAAPLTSLGVTVVGRYPYGATLDDWRAAGFAAATLVVDRTLYPKTVRALEARGQRVTEVPLPIGVGQTDKFYAELGAAIGQPEQLAAALAPARAAAVAALDAFRSRHGGERLVMGLRMLNDYRSDQIAFHGLGDYEAIRELGFDVTVLVQGPRERKERFAKLFEARGYSFPFETFAEPWNLSELLVRDRYDIAYLADYCREECRKARVPMVTSRHLLPYYDGVVRNVEALERAITLARTNG